MAVIRPKIERYVLCVLNSIFLEFAVLQVNKKMVTSDNNNNHDICGVFPVYRFLGSSIMGEMRSSGSDVFIGIELSNENQLLNTCLWLSNLKK
jgi:hypothetical protein